MIRAALWPDPADEHCPQAFRDAAAKHLVAFAKRVNPIAITEERRQLQESLSPESQARWEVFPKDNTPLDLSDAAHPNVPRFALLDFIADFANWDNSSVPAYPETSRADVGPARTYRACASEDHSRTQGGDREEQAVGDDVPVAGGEQEGSPRLRPVGPEQREHGGLTDETNGVPVPGRSRVFFPLILRSAGRTSDNPADESG